MLENCELRPLPMGSFLDRALKMSPIFRQTLCDIIIFLMNRKSRNDGYSVFHVYSLLGPHRADSFISVEAQPAGTLYIQGLTVSCSVCSRFFSCRFGWLARGVYGFYVSLRSPQSERHNEGHGSLS